MLRAKDRSGLEREDYEERRRKWRRSGFWRGVLAVVVLIFALGALAAWLSGPPRFGPHVAMVRIDGVIRDDMARDRLLKSIQKNEDVKALVVRVNSPGGTTVGSEALYARLRAIAEVKPVVAQIGEVAASGGYIAALGADHVIARGNSITGSIGVIMEYPEVVGLLEKLGVEMQTVRSSELKAEPSPFREATPESLAVEKALIEESYQWFRGLVAERRGLQGAGLDAVTDGRVFTGRMALDAGLIDAIGGYDEVLAWLDSHESVPDALPVDLYEPETQDEGFFGASANFLAKNAGLERFYRQSGPRLYSIAK